MKIFLNSLCNNKKVDIRNNTPISLHHRMLYDYLMMAVKALVFYIFWATFGNNHNYNQMASRHLTI